MGLGLQPVLKKLTIDQDMNFQDEIIEFAKSKNIKYVADNLGQDQYSKDFGKIYKVIPRTILLPVSADQLKEIITFANAKKIPLTARGAAHSVTGQSMVINNSGVSVDLRAFNQIGTIDSGSDGNATLSCSPGVTLGQLNKFTLASGYMAPAIPFFPELTVGGVLAAGGIGSASHRQGLMISNVAEMRVLTGNGSFVSCTPYENPDIFNAVLGTFGHFGIITNVKLKMVESKKLFRVLRLIYDDIDTWFSDYQLLLKTVNISNLQGILIKSGPDKTLWNFMLEVSLQVNSEDELREHEGVLSKLKFKDKLPSSDLTPDAFLNRYQSRFDEMRKSGKYDQSHPFLEFVISADKAKELIQQTFKILPATYEDGFRLIFIDKKNLPPYFMVPPSESICMFAILPTGIMQQDLPVCLRAAEQLHQYALSLGAKRYLSGWLGMMNSDELKNHFDSKAAELMQLKRKMDPGNILRSQFSEKLCSWLVQ